MHTPNYRPLQSQSFQQPGGLPGDPHGRQMVRREDHETHLSICSLHVRTGGGLAWASVPLTLLERSPAGARGPGGDPQQAKGGVWRPMGPCAPASCLTEQRWQHHTHRETGEAKTQTRCPVAVYWRQVLEASICYFCLCQSHVMGGGKL